MPGRLVAETRQIDIRKQALAGAEQDGPDGQMHLVDQAACRYCRMVATPPPRRMSPPPAAPFLLQRRLNALGDKTNIVPPFIERRTA